MTIGLKLKMKENGINTSTFIRPAASLCPGGEWISNKNLISAVILIIKHTFHLDCLPARSRLEEKLYWVTQPKYIPNK